MAIAPACLSLGHCNARRERAEKAEADLAGAEAELARLQVRVWTLVPGTPVLPQELTRSLRSIHAVTAIKVRCLCPHQIVITSTTQCGRMTNMHSCAM